MQHLGRIESDTANADIIQKVCIIFLLKTKLKMLWFRR